MMSSNNWRIPQTADDYLRSTEKRIMREERRPQPTSAADLLGPIMSAKAIQLLDWNAEEATFNGFVYGPIGTFNAPTPDYAYTGMIIGREDGSGMQQVWEPTGMAETLHWVRTFRPNPEMEGEVIFDVWKKFATGSGLIGVPEIDPDYTDGVIEIIDVNIDEKLQEFADEFDIAQDPRMVFRQPDEPVAEEPTEENPNPRPLTAGDIWFDTDDNNRVYIYNGTSWVSVDNAVLVDLEGRLTEVSNEIAAAAQAAADSFAFAETKNKTFRQGDEPNATSQGPFRVGDIWFDTSRGNLIMVWTGSAWVDSRDTLVLQTAQQAADALGDAQAAVDAASAAQTTAQQAALDAAEAEALAQAAMEAAENASGGTTGTKVWRQPSQPASGHKTGDLWFDTDDGNRMRFYDGTNWVVMDSSWLATTSGLLTITPQGLIGKNAQGATTVTLAADTGQFTTSGAILTSGEVNGAVVTGGTVQTQAEANRGVKINSAGLAAYNTDGVAVMSFSTSTGGLTLTGPVLSGGTISSALFQTSTAANQGIKITTLGLTAYNSDGGASVTISNSGVLTTVGPILTGGSLTGGVVQTSANANTGLKITSSGLTAYKPDGTISYQIDAATGNVIGGGDTTVGGNLTGAIITGGTVQTQAEASRGIKMNSTGLTAYNSSGSAIFTLSASTGQVNIVGDANAIRVTGGTFTGALIQTTATANRGVKITSNGLVAYTAGGSPMLTVDSNSSIVSLNGSFFSGGSIDGSIITGGTVQTQNNPSGTTPRGIKMNSSGLIAYNSSGSPVFTLSASTGEVVMKGTLSSGSSIAAGITLSAPNIIGGSISGVNFSGTTFSGVTMNSSTIRTSSFSTTSGSGSGVHIGTNSMIVHNGSLQAFAVSADVYVGADMTANRAITCNSNVRAVRFITGVGTSGSAANAVIDSAGMILRTGSSRRYKKWISDYDFDTDAFLDLHRRRYQWRADWLDGTAAGEPNRWYYGLVAEEVHDAGLTEFVEYDEQGRPDLVAYPMLTLPLMQVAREHRDRLAEKDQQITALTDEVQSLNSTVEALLARMDAAGI